MKETEKKETEEGCCACCHVHDERHHAHHEHHHDSLSCGCCHDDDDDGDEEDKGKTVRKMVVSALLLVAGIVIAHADIPGAAGAQPFARTIPLAMFLVSYLIIGKDIIRGAISNIRRGNIFGEQFLMTIASVGAVLIGEPAEGVAILLLYTVGEFFQDYAVDKSRASISSLMDIRPETARAIRNGTEQTVSPETIAVGETIEVRPGERIALDGRIISGESFADTSALTGESVPRRIAAGDEVLAGFINTEGVIRIETTKEFSESAVSRILHLTKEASEVKAKSEKFITRFAKVYTPAVCIAALAVALIPPALLKLAGNDVSFRIWFYRALMFLVVSCPCALAISIPLSFYSGIGAASKNGILVKGSNFIESLAKARTFVFDKTGTLTKGVFKVSKVVCSGGFSPEELVALANSAESKSNHPIARSIAEHAAENLPEKEIPGADDITEIAGLGVVAHIGGQKVAVGNARLMEKECARGFKKENADDFCGTVVHVAVGGTYAGAIHISDELKENAANAISGIRKSGARKIAMLTGDSESAARKIAGELGLDEFHAALLPEQKVAHLESYIAENAGAVAFVGDGVNDSPVLARADIGIAMGAIGSDASIEAADIVIMDDNIARIPTGIRIAKKTVSIVWQNIVFSLAIKTAIMVLSALGITNMWFAVFGDVGVCFLAVLNAMRALK